MDVNMIKTTPTRGKVTLNLDNIFISLSLDKISNLAESISKLSIFC